MIILQFFSAKVTFAIQSPFANDDAASFVQRLRLQYSRQLQMIILQFFHAKVTFAIQSPVANDDTAVL